MRLFLISAFLFLFMPSSSKGCGPGSLFNVRRVKARKLTPLVFSEAVPNIDESSVYASGPNDKPITSTSDPSFVRLVTNHDSSIMYSDKVGDGLVSLSTPRLRERLNRLGIMVLNYFPGVKLKVIKSFELPDSERSHMHSGRHSSLHYAGRAADIALSDNDRSKLGLLSRLAVEAGLDYVKFSSKSHVHVSVRAEGEHRFGGCFSGESLVRTQNGDKKLSNLQIGDSVMYVDDLSEGRVAYSKVISFLDADPQKKTLFLRISTQNNRSLLVTPSHLMYASYEPDKDSMFVDYAKHVVPGMFLFVVKEDNLVFDEISKIDTVLETGYFAPLLLNDETIVVNQIVVSTFAVIRNPKVAKYAMLPLRLYDNLKEASSFLLKKMTLLPERRTNKQKQREEQHGIHPYAKMLYYVAELLLPTEFLY